MKIINCKDHASYNAFYDADYRLYFFVLSLEALL